MINIELNLYLVCKLDQLRFKLFKGIFLILIFKYPTPQTEC